MPRFPWERAIPPLTSATPIRAEAPASTIGNVPFEVTVYTVGDRSVAARSNEFGYPNYGPEDIKNPA